MCFPPRKDRKSRSFDPGWSTIVLVTRQAVVNPKLGKAIELVLIKALVVLIRGQVGLDARATQAVNRERKLFPRRGMPRRKPRPEAVQSAHAFVQVFIAGCSSDDHILPKNGELALPWSPGRCASWSLISHRASLGCVRLIGAGLRLCREIFALSWFLPHAVAPRTRQGRRRVGRWSDALCREQDGRPLL